MNEETHIHIEIHVYNKHIKPHRLFTTYLKYHGKQAKTLTNLNTRFI